jgi:thymidylate synthase ThyX
MISAHILCDSANIFGERLTTFLLVYPRFIHAQMLTHRMFSRNTSSSRAIPVARMIEHVKEDPAYPILWGQNKPGMQATEVLTYPESEWASTIWKSAMEDAVKHAQALAGMGVHKQIVNRLLEPFQHVQVVLTGTDWTNFFGLRVHEDAQPEIAELALRMAHAMLNSDPMLIQSTEWHLPYIIRERNAANRLVYRIPNKGIDTPGWEHKPVSLEDALKISVSCCAQVSYRALDTGLEKAEKIINRLQGSSPKHMSPFEHQATPFSQADYRYLEENYPEFNEESWFNDPVYSGNFRTYIQYRKMIPGECIRK